MVKGCLYERDDKKGNMFPRYLTQGSCSCKIRMWVHGVWRLGLDNFWGQRQTLQLEIRLNLEKYIIYVPGFSHGHSDKHFSFLLKFDKFVM